MMGNTCSESQFMMRVKAKKGIERERERKHAGNGTVHKTSLGALDGLKKDVEATGDQTPSWITST